MASNIWNDVLAQVEAQQLAFTPENSANKATSFSVLNHTLYPSVQAVATYVAASISGSGITALTGDVTATGPGSSVATIGAGKVTNSMLAGSIAYSKLSLTGAILNADLAGSIAYSKLSLTGAILNADLAGSIAYSKLSLTGAILNADLAGSIAASKLVGTDIATVGTIATGTWSATAIAVNKGGTNITSYAVGDLLYASGSTTLSKLADVAVGSVLVSGGVTTAPAWSNAPLLSQLGLGIAPATWASTDIQFAILGNGITGDANIKLWTSNTGSTNTDGFNFGIENSTKDVYINQRENANVFFYVNGSPALSFSPSQVVAMPHYGAGTATFDSSGNISSVSDERLKDIVGNFWRGLAAIRSIKPILYQWKKGDDSKGVYPGFTAQNVMRSIPEAVAAGPDGFYGLQDRGLIAALVNAVNELDEKVTRLQR